jgi:hypothetical protein
MMLRSVYGGGSLEHTVTLVLYAGIAAMHAY